MDEMDVAEIMRRIGHVRGIITPDQAIAYQEAEINQYRERIKSMETEIKARAEHIRILEETEPPERRISRRNPAAEKRIIAV